MRRRSPTIHELRRGHTLLEIILAGALIATALVPALRLMRDGLRISREIETGELLTTFCVSKLEEHLALTSADWQDTDYSGDFSAEGYSNLRFEVECSDSGGDGGITDELMAVTATVWDDLDGDGSFDSEQEPSVVLGSKVAKLVNYQNEVGGG